MKCKVFKLHTQNESDESKLNEFLESVEVKQIFAQVINQDAHYWSILAFYEDGAKPETIKSSVSSPPLAAAEPKSAEKTASEAIILTPEQENVFNELKKWRNEKASRDGIPPYMIAHNFSLVQIAASSVKVKEDLVGIKGFGEKRAEKYGDEILAILGGAANESESDN